MELFEQIRREYEHGGGTIRGIAKKLGIHRRMVREALLECGSDASERKRCERNRSLRPAMAFIDAHSGSGPQGTAEATAHGTSDLVPDPSGDAGSGSGGVHGTALRSEAEDRVRAGARETFRSPVVSWGAEAQVDWFEAYARSDGERQKAYVFCMRSMASGGAFHCAYPHASQQAFLEAHERAFAYFGGVLRRFDTTI